MPYTPIDHQHITDPTLAKVFRHAAMLLRDLYSVFLCDPPAGFKGGHGNFTVVLVLLCIIDGLAREVSPTTWRVPKWNVHLNDRVHSASWSSLAAYRPRGRLASAGLGRLLPLPWLAGPRDAAAHLTVVPR
jgi:hypothetical protein